MGSYNPCRPAPSEAEGSMPMEPESMAASTKRHPARVTARFGCDAEGRLQACDVTKSQESLAVLAPVARALESAFGVAAGVPDGLELRSDHGSQYTGDDCLRFCQAWRLVHTFAPVGRPTGNAVAERVTTLGELRRSRAGPGFDRKSCA